MNTDRISVKQLRSLYFVSVLSPAVRLLPNSTILHAKNASWLSPLFALIPVLLYAYFLYGAAKHHKEGEGIGEMLSCGIGKPAAKTVLLLCGVWLSFYAGFLLRVDAERLYATIYKDGNVFMFVMASLIIALLVARTSVRGLARMAEVFLPVLVAVLGLSCVLALVDIKAEYLLPVTGEDIPGALIGAIPIINVLATGAYFLLLLENTEKAEGSRQILLRGGLWVMLGVAAVIVTVTGTLSAPLANHLNNPFFVMARNLSVFGVNERVEAVVIALWVVTDLIFAAAMLRASAAGLKAVFVSGDIKKYVWAAAAGALTGAVFCAKDAFVLSKVSEYWVPLVNLFFTCFLFPLLFLIGAVKNRRKKK